MGPVIFLPCLSVTRGRRSIKVVAFIDAQIRGVICTHYHGSGASVFHPSEAQECVIEENDTFLNNGRLSLPGEEVRSS